MHDYLQLMRIDKPIGWLLLLWPTLSACWLASGLNPDATIVWVFSVGVFVMRAAGCVINDIADKDIDLRVLRTQTRPLAAGRLSNKQAWCLFFALAAVALILLLLLPNRVWLWAIPAALITIIYPYSKRFFFAPQLVLGVAFSFSIPMVFSTLQHDFGAIFYCLFFGNLAWVVAYDTAYAMADREDDLQVGIHSTAILFGSCDKLAVFICQALYIVSWLVIAALLPLPLTFYIGLSIAIMLLLYQQWLIRHRDRDACFRAFLNNGWVGGLIWFSLMLCALE